MSVLEVEERGCSLSGMPRKVILICTHFQMIDISMIWGPSHFLFAHGDVFQ